MMGQPYEPDAQAALNEVGLTATPEDVSAIMLCSIAVSLKRIADTLDGTTAGVCVTDTIFGGRRDAS